jgi:hypothetical protein
MRDNFSSLMIVSNMAGYVQRMEQIEGLFLLLQNLLNLLVTVPLEV